MKTKPVIVAVAVVVEALLSSPSAEADTNSYIARLQQDGVPMLSGPVPAVQTGLTDGTDLEIVSGVKTGDMVIVEGQNGLPDDAKVTVDTGEDEDEAPADDKEGEKGGKGETSGKGADEK